MSESSCAVKAAAHLAAYADYMDLDGPLLISNDPFSAFSFNNNIFSFSEKAGLGIEKISEAFYVLK
jgi:L-alanine-DL-glutamate epimerase-like enolase superfamily enzyme